MKKNYEALVSYFADDEFILEMIADAWRLRWLSSL